MTNRRIPKYYAMRCPNCGNVNCILVAEDNHLSGFLFGTECGLKSTVYYIEANSSMERIMHTIHDDLILNPTIAKDDPTDPSIVNHTTDHNPKGFALSVLEYFLAFAGAPMDRTHTAVVQYVEVDKGGNPIANHFLYPIHWEPPLYLPNYRKPDVEAAWSKTKATILMDTPLD